MNCHMRLTMCLMNPNESCSMLGVLSVVPTTVCRSSLVRQYEHCGALVCTRKTRQYRTKASRAHPHAPQALSLSLSPSHPLPHALSLSHARRSLTCSAIPRLADAGVFARVGSCVCARSRVTPWGGGAAVQAMSCESTTQTRIAGGRPTRGATNGCVRGEFQMTLAEWAVTPISHIAPGRGGRHERR